jgi:hypothetical protein
MIRKLTWPLLLTLLGWACTGDPKPGELTTAGTALTDTLEQLIPAARPQPLRYPGPDPFVGNFANDPTVEGFARTLSIDSGDVSGYRVSFLATEISGSPLCNHAATFDRVAARELRGRIEGSTLRILARDTTLEVLPLDTTMLATPGLLCPGASVFGPLLAQ